MKVLAMSCCLMDLFPQLNKSCVGGNSVNVAVQCKRSGIDQVAVLGAVGEDEYGTEIIKELTRQGIDTSHLHQCAGSTANRIIMLGDKGERLFFPENWHPGVFAAFRLSQADWDFVAGFDIIAGLANDPNFTELLMHKTEENLLCIDYLNSRKLPLIQENLDTIDISFINGTPWLVEQLQPLSQITDNPIVVSLGSKGSAALHKGLTYRQEALSVNKIIDTTGCSDAYLAAFSIDWYKYRDINKALICGAQAAAAVSRRTGAV